jgi:predicted nuclease of predicted toxin-antitoxin system
MKFKIDENFPPEAAPLLKRHGHDALTVWDQNLRGTTDQNLANVCQTEARILLTLDLDFADIRAYPPSSSAGIIVLRLGHQGRKQVVNVLTQFLPLLESQPISGHLWVVDETNVRIYGEDTA